MPPDTEDGVRTLLLTTLLVCGAVVAPTGAAGVPATGSSHLGSAAAAGNTSTAPTVSASVEPRTPFSGRRVTLIANVTGETVTAVDWTVETPSRGTVDRDGTRARFRFRTAGSYTVRLAVTDGDGQTMRANTTVEMVRTNVRLRGPDGPPPNATLVLDGAGAVGAGVFAVPDDGRVPVLLRKGADYAATTLQDRDRTTPLHPDPGPADGVPDFAVLGRVTAGDDARFRLPVAEPVTVRVVDAGGDRVVPRGRNTAGAVGIAFRHDHPRLPASGFRALATNATGVAVVDGRPPELAGNVSVTVVPLAERFARTDRRLRRNLTGGARTTVVLDDGTATATARLPEEAVVGEAVQLNVTSPASVANATWTVVGPDDESRRRDGRQTTFVPQTPGAFDVTVAVETAAGTTAVDRARLRVANRTAVTGVVRGPDGAPVADAVVRLYRVGDSRTATAVRAGDGPPRRPTSAALARTDATGRFTATLAAGREYRAVVAQTPLVNPPRDGVPDVTLLDRFTAGVDDPGGRLPTARRVSVAAVDGDGEPLTTGLTGNTSGEVAVFLGHTPDGPEGPVGWLPGRATVGGSGDSDDATATDRVVVEVPGSVTLLGTARVDWLTDTARVNHTDSDTARLVVPARDQTPPVARLAAPTRTRLGETVTLDATNSTDAYGIARYDWDGSGQLQPDGATAAWTPETAGNRTVRVTATDPAGNVGTATATVVVQPAEAGSDGSGGSDESGEDGGSDGKGDESDGDTGDDTGSSAGDDTTEPTPTAPPTETRTGSPTETRTNSPTETPVGTERSTTVPSSTVAETPRRTVTPQQTAGSRQTATPPQPAPVEPNWSPSGESTTATATVSRPTPTPPGRLFPPSLRPPAWLPWSTTETPVTALPPVGAGDTPRGGETPRGGGTPRHGDTVGSDGQSGRTGDGTSEPDGGSGASPVTLSLVALSSLAVGWVAGTHRDRRERDGGDEDDPNPEEEPR